MLIRFTTYHDYDLSGFWFYYRTALVSMNLERTTDCVIAVVQLIRM